MLFTGIFTSLDLILLPTSYLFCCIIFSAVKSKTETTSTELVLGEDMLLFEVVGLNIRFKDFLCYFCLCLLGTFF